MYLYFTQLTLRLIMSYIYIYDISSLRVNDLTLILLTWRKWWTPNNASKWQMRFNSAFKGLNTFFWEGVHTFHQTLKGVRGAKKVMKPVVRGLCIHRTAILQMCLNSGALEVNAEKTHSHLTGKMKSLSHRVTDIEWLYAWLIDLTFMCPCIII